MRFVWCALLLVACAHSDTFVTPPIPPEPPFSTGSDVQISFNTEQDYWPSWNGDGKGILYAYVDDERVNHRCLGMLAPQGGTRLWQLCDNRAVRDDSLTSYAAFAMDTAGQLLVAEAVAPRNSPLSEIPRVTLWLADTAHPYQRTSLLVLPIVVSNTPVSWLSDLAWTSPTSFLVLGQQFNTLPHCVEFLILTNGVDKPAQQCLTRDTVWADTGGVVLRGVIAGGHATLEAVAGTGGATSFSLAEGGASIAYTLKDRALLFKVPVAGGTPAPSPTTAKVDPTLQLVGVSCKGTTCIVARDSVALSETIGVTYSSAHFFFEGLPKFPFVPPYSVPMGNMELHRVSLTSGIDERLAFNETHDPYATPKISPVSGDVIVQLGGGWGHLQTFETVGQFRSIVDVRNSVLHLLKGLVP